MTLPFRYQAIFTTIGALVIFFFFESEENHYAPFRRSFHRRTQTEEHDQRFLVHRGDTLRVATFGSSNAWGAGMKNRFDAYPYLLSPEVDNYADFSAGPNYPAVCTQTLVGEDKLYDVIVIDFWLHQGCASLAKKLRRRFPRAVIVFLKLWTPNHAKRKETPESSHDEELNLEEWKTLTEIPNNDYESVKDALLKDKGTWYFPTHPKADAMIEEASVAVGGSVFSFPFKETAKDTIIDYLGYFDELSHAHVSERGHKAIAKYISMIVKAQMKARDEHPADFPMKSDVAGTWGDGDNCHLWYTTGVTFASYKNMQMVEFDEVRGKFALELDPNNEGWIDVENRLHTPRTLYLSFLATVEDAYPLTKVTYNATMGVEETLTTMVEVIEPSTRRDSKKVHLTKTVPLKGKLAAHTTTRIYFSAMEPKLLNFRLVGISFTDEDTVPMEIDFGPTFNA